MDYLAVAVLYFTLYAFAGWVYELLLNLLWHRQLRLRGYLHLPLLPIYGFGALAIIAAAQGYADSPFFVFAVASLMATVLELASSILLEKLFGVRLWDYADFPLNLNGRVSIVTSGAFGLLGLLLVYVLQPWFTQLIGAIPGTTITVIGLAALAVILIDAVNTTVSLAFLRNDMRKLVDATIDDVQHYVADRLDELRARRKMFRAFTRRLEQWNIAQLRKAFPRARIVLPSRRQH